MRPKAAGYRNIGNRVWHCISVLQNAADISPLSVVHDLNAKLRGCCPDFVATPLFQSPALQHAVQALESCTSRNTHTPLNTEMVVPSKILWHCIRSIPEAASSALPSFILFPSYYDAIVASLRVFKRSVWNQKPFNTPWVIFWMFLMKSQ